MAFSLLVGLKNNLLYTRHFYAQTRLLYPDLELVFVSYNSTDGTHQWLDSLHDDHVTYYYGEQERTLSDTYNKCLALATTEYVIFAHNDLVLTPGFIEQLARLQTLNRVIAYTTVEPPIFADDERPGKIVRDFGADVVTFQREALFQFSEDLQRRNQPQNQFMAPFDQVTFFVCVARTVLLDIGGLDPLFNPMFCEDDDLLLRLSLLGLERVVSLNAIAYHFVSKTSRFSDEYRHRTQRIEAQSNRNFIRKWGFRPTASVKKKYDIGLIVRNGNLTLLRALEPWCATLYIDVDPSPYLLEEQLNTAIDLRKKIRPIQDQADNGIIVTVDARHLNAARTHQIEGIQEAIHHRITKSRSLWSRLLTKKTTRFTWHTYRILIRDETSYEEQLIYKP